MLDGAMTVWFVMTGLSLAFVIWDSVSNGVTSWVQRAAWILVTAYTGVFGLFFYLVTCRRPFVGGHDQFTKPVWKQAVNSEMHCLAGDATGILIAALILSLFELANGWDAVAEYAAGFIFGLFIFQALMMLGMYQGDYMLAVRKTVFAETVSMNFVMAGMIPVMVILADYWPESRHPGAASFWFRMSLASVVGGFIAYPINYWLVASHLKHGCMTLPGADGPAPKLGHSSPETSMHHDHGAHAHHHGAGDGRSGDMEHAAHGAHGMHGGMQMRSLSLPVAAAWVVFSFAILFAALIATNIYTPIRF
ncbi:MAG: membrane protein [Rhizobiaceae bacterium MnEN-MB40S]|nr:MAG: membrane protein [Rhizobiaceae bacterium MnEN-MB40S]